MSDNVVKGLGHHGLWGFSPSFDIFEAILNTCELNNSSEPINILLIHPGDIRHILYTISRNKRYLTYLNTRPIHFYLLDSCVEILARNLLLLEVFIDFEIPIRQRANIFLEIFGNVKVQERTARYIEQLGQKLISLAVNSIATLEIVDLQHLKYKDRDNLENVFKSYSRKIPCDMISLRDHRLRGYYAERYDSRRALGDWDWQYSYRETAASIIHITLYRDWRETGVAFEFGDQTYVEGNRTMLTYVEGTLKRGKDAGHHKEIKGFWSDITCSPYFSFGLEADYRSPPLSTKAAEYTEGLFEIINKGTGTEQHRHHTVEVAVYNMFSMLWEIEMGVPYSLSRKNDIYSGLGEKDGGKEKQNQKQLNTNEQNNEKNDNHDDDNSEFVRVEEILDTIEENDNENEELKEESELKEEEVKNNIESKETRETISENEEEMLKQELKRAECIVETFRNIKIFPLVGNASEILKKSKFQNNFDCLFVSSRSAHFLQDSLANDILRTSPNKSLIITETSKYITTLLKDQKKEFIEKEKEFANLHNWTYLSTDPVPKRKRDENDTMKDTLFFLKT